MDDPYLNFRFSDIQDKGFLVIPSFLLPDEIEFFLNDYLAQGSTDNKNYELGAVSSASINRLLHKMELINSHVKKSTDIDVDVSAVHCGYYFASKKVSFDWHVDHESYYELQNHYDYLNFYIPIQKPLKEKGNLRVVPMDVLQENCPDLAKKLKGSGGTTFSQVAGKTVVVSDIGIEGELPFDIEDFGYTPELNAGDLLLVRGDVVHQTQDVDTDRVAMSVRLTNPNTQIDLKKLLTGGKRKTDIMINNWTDFFPVIQAFQKAGRASMTWAELRNVVEQLKEKGANAGWTASKPRVYLLKQKLFKGELFTSFKCWLGLRRASKYIQNLDEANRR